MKSWIARVALFLFVGLAIGVYRVGSWLRGKRKRPANHPFRVFLIGNFDSVGWLSAHAGPLVKCRSVDEVYVICDEPLPLEMKDVTFHCADADLRRRFGRGGARIIVLLQLARKLRPQVYMGYHIMPNSPLALIAAGLFGGKAIYQMTGGPIQVLDGGVQSENPLLRATRTPSKLQESLLCQMVRCFDLVIVRGTKAKAFVTNRVAMPRCEVLTGAIDTARFSPEDRSEKEWDLVLVSRLVASFKGVERFIDVVGILKTLRPGIRATIVGDGPDRDLLMKRATDRGVTGSIEFAGRCRDVRGILNRSKIFVLLSPSEGMSIAMLEAMSCALPVVVTDVGELGDALRVGAGGELIEYGSAEDAAKLLEALLSDEQKRSQMAANARNRIVGSYSVEAVARLWESMLSENPQVVPQAMDPDVFRKEIGFRGEPSSTNGCSRG
ncbi:MAG: glycosyltransferase family 4 protein [Verrucomicrobiota bacterium]